MIVIVIPAKGKSSRLPNKNITLLNGRPMIEYSIDEARLSKRADQIYVSTDSDEIAAHVEKMGVKVIRRSKSLGGDVPIIDVYRHALSEMPNGDKVEVLVGLQPDHPDRDIRVDEALEIFERESVDRLMSKQKDDEKNGSYYVLSRHFLTHGESRHDVTIVDDCTNIHYPEDLKRAEARLSNRKA